MSFLVKHELIIVLYLNWSNVCNNQIHTGCPKYQLNEIEEYIL
jgi:hypothetical protein